MQDKILFDLDNPILRPLISQPDFENKGYL